MRPAEPNRRRAARARTACAVLILGWAASLAGQNPRNVHNVGPEPFASRVVASGLSDPWEVLWGPDDHLWVTERTGFRVTRINPADGSKHVALQLDDVYQSVVQDGLLGMALHPDLLRGRGRDHVYLAYTYDRDPGAAIAVRLRIRRYTYDASTQNLTAPADILDDLPAHDDHGAGRIVVGPDDKLYLTRGDHGANWLANYCRPIRSQELPTEEDIRAHRWDAYQGKILRINLDGSIPGDNPVLGGVRSHVHSYGFRNPQGLAFGPTGLLYISEHGPSTDDEVNLVEAGRNYGWPHVAGYRDDRSYVYANWSASAPTPCRELKFSPLVLPAPVPRAKETEWNHPDFVEPMATLFTVPEGYDLAETGSATIAPAGIAVYTSATIPGWATSILVTGMRTGAVYRLKLSADGRRVDGAPVEYFKADDRYRDVTLAPDGRRVFFVTDSHGATADAQGGRTDQLAHPGALLEFTYAGTPSGRER